MTKGEAIRIVEHMAARQDSLGGSGFMTTAQHSAVKMVLAALKAANRNTGG